MKLSNLLVLSSAPGAPTRNCNQFLLQLSNEGAMVQQVQSTADVALTRNNQAAIAKEALETSQTLEWVLWVDWDISSGVDSVLLMMAIAEALSVDGYIPSVSGSYVNRHLSDGKSELACWAIKGAVVTPVSIEGAEPNAPSELLPSEVSCVPALTGMGCLLQHRSAFLAHCVESEWFVYPRPPHKIPCVCQSHVSHAAELHQYLEVDPNSNDLFWVAEDFDYCMREYDAGRLVYIAPIAFGHDKVQRLLPDSKTVFPGLRQPLTVVD